MRKNRKIHLSKVDLHPSNTILAIFYYQGTFFTYLTPCDTKLTTFQWRPIGGEKQVSISGGSPIPHLI